jgi:hypothetical protein
VVAFLLITFAGKTTERMDPFAQLTPWDVPMRAVEVVLGAFQDLLASAPRILLDPFFREDIVAAVLSAGFVVALLATIALFLLMRRTAAAEHPTARTLLWTLVSGLAVFLAALSPFMVISYYIPARALYLPSLGLALMVGSFAAWSTRFLRAQVSRNFFAGTVASVTLLFVLINQYAQHDFARGWELEKGIIEALASERNAIPEGTEISIHNIPRNFGPTPDFHNRFALNGIINWLAPGRSLSGTTLRDFSDVFALPEDVSAVTHSKIYPSERDWILLWSPIGIYRIATLVLERDGHNNDSLPTAVDQSGTRPSRIESIQLKGSVTPLELQARYDGDLQVGLSGIITNKHFDLALLPVTIAGTAALERKLHLYAHAHHTNGIKVPYDASVSERGGFTAQTDGYTKYLFLRNWSSIEKVRISLADSYHGRLTPGGNKRAEIEKPTFSPAYIEFF